MPAEKHRWLVLLFFVGLSGCIPDVAMITDVPVDVLPAVLGAFLAVYWRPSTLQQKILIAILASCAIFVLRLFTNRLIFGYSDFTGFMTEGWIKRRAVFTLFGLQLVPAFLTLIPLHFVLSLTNRRSHK